MADVSITDLRANTVDLVARAASGEHLTVIRSGKPVATISPAPKPGLNLELILSRRKYLPPIEGIALRDSLDDAIDSSV